MQSEEIVFVMAKVPHFGAGIFRRAVDTSADLQKIYQPAAFPKGRAKREIDSGLDATGGDKNPVLPSAC